MLWVGRGIPGGTRSSGMQQNAFTSNLLVSCDCPWSGDVINLSHRHSSDMKVTIIMGRAKLWRNSSL